MQLNETTVQKRRKEKLRQMNTREDVDKAAVAQVHKYIARFWYQAGLPFNLIQSQYFKDMVEAIGAYGKHLPAPSFHGIRGPLLSKELEYTDSLVKPKKKEWSRHGCTIMLDGWTDQRQRTIINVLVSSIRGTIFVKSIDATCFVKTEKKLFKLLDSLVDEIGEEHVVRVVTDNGSNYVAAGKMLMEKRKHLYWTPCAAQCINLMLEDIGKLPLIKETIQKGISLVGYIHSHTFTLNLLETFTNKKELMRPAVTRFATSFLTLERIHEEKDNLRRMFTSVEWVQNTLSKDAKGREVTEIVMMTSFWENVVYILKVMEPLVRVLRLVVGEKKLAIGYIYEAMEKAKETIGGSFENNEQRYGDIFKIIDDRWNCQLHSPLHAAGHILNPAIYYDNKGLEFDFKVTKGLHDCIDRLVPTEEDRNKILRELSIYEKGEDLFGIELAQRLRKDMDPGEIFKT